MAIGPLLYASVFDIRDLQVLHLNALNTCSSWRLNMCPKIPVWKPNPCGMVFGGRMTRRCVGHGIRGGIWQKLTGSFCSLCLTRMLG